ncbi:hypothetical protein ACMFMG_003482 [Clarireedia jacksonii]
MSDPGFGGANANDTSIKSKLINLMTSVRTLMRNVDVDIPFQKGEKKIHVGVQTGEGRERMRYSRQGDKIEASA